MAPGVFIGYHLRAGGRWSGDYLVLDAEAYRKRMEGASVPTHRIKEIHFGDSMRFPVKDGAIESLPEEVREMSWPLGSSASAADATEPSMCDRDRGDTISPSEDKDATGGMQSKTETQTEPQESSEMDF